MAQTTGLPNFEVFTRRRLHTPATTPACTIQARGGLSFNQAAYEALKAPKYVELLFDRNQRIVGVRATDEGNAHAYPVKSPDEKRDSGFLVGGRSFTLYYGIDTTTARRWTAYMFGDILCVDLKAESVVVTGPRAKDENVGLFISPGGVTPAGLRPARGRFKKVQPT